MAPWSGFQPDPASVVAAQVSWQLLRSQGLCQAQPVAV